MKFDMPNTTGMTTAQKLDVLQAAVLQTHGCLESHRQEMAKGITRLGGELGELKASQSVNNAFTEALAKRMGLNLDVNDEGEVRGVEKVKAAVGAWSMRKTLMVGLPLLGGLFALLQFLFLAAPGVASAVYHAVMAMHR